MEKKSGEEKWRRERERERAIRVGSYTNKSGAECKDDNGCSSSLGLLTEPEKKKMALSRGGQSIVAYLSLNETLREGGS
jgi:hypothetical protein